jgi:hypothetical protein
MILSIFTNDPHKNHADWFFKFVWAHAFNWSKMEATLARDYNAKMLIGPEGILGVVFKEESDMSLFLLRWT